MHPDALDRQWIPPRSSSRRRDDSYYPFQRTWSWSVQSALSSHIHFVVFREMRFWDLLCICLNFCRPFVSVPGPRTNEKPSPEFYTCSSGHLHPTAASVSRLLHHCRHHRRHQHGRLHHLLDRRELPRSGLQNSFWCVKRRLWPCSYHRNLSLAATRVATPARIGSWSSL
jgi:hypothetical protein